MNMHVNSSWSSTVTLEQSTKMLSYNHICKKFCTGFLRRNRFISRSFYLDNLQQSALAKELMFQSESVWSPITFLCSPQSRGSSLPNISPSLSGFLAHWTFFLGVNPTQHTFSVSLTLHQFRSVRQPCKQHLLEVLKVHSINDLFDYSTRRLWKAPEIQLASLFTFCRINLQEFGV